jgi:regulator of cell morphogenesis and NO signaling
MTTATKTVREIALERPSSIRVFEKLGIDYCCGGRKPLADACLENNLEINAVLAALESTSDEHSVVEVNWGTTSLQRLIEHIVSSHHAYVKQELPRLAVLAEKVVARHGETTPHLFVIKSTVAQLDAELTHHLGKEEMVLFPYIVSLEHALTTGAELPASCFGTVANPIAMMTQEHDAAGALLADLRKLSNGFVPPEGACPTYHAFYDGLREFEQDLHQHIHLENNILFPRAIAMENTAG